MDVRNGVKAKVEGGGIAFGSWIHHPTPSMVETLALAGLDFVRLDQYHVAYNRETVEDMTRAPTRSASPRGLASATILGRSRPPSTPA